MEALSPKFDVDYVTNASKTTLDVNCNPRRLLTHTEDHNCAVAISSLSIPSHESIPMYACTYMYTQKASYVMNGLLNRLTTQTIQNIFCLFLLTQCHFGRKKWRCHCLHLRLPQL